MDLRGRLQQHGRHQTITVFDDVAPVVTFGEMLVEMSCEDYDDAVIDDNILIDVLDECGRR